MTPAINAGPDVRPWTRRAMLVRAFIAQNSTVGLTYGGFGITILPLQDRFDAGRGAVSLGLSLVVMMTGFAAPMVAHLSHRFGLRAIMVVGALLCAAGYAMLAIAPSLPLALAAYALLLGPGVGLAGTLPASMLAGGWYPQARGRAIGLTTMPVVLALTPMVGVGVIAHGGLPAFFGGLAMVHLMIVPVLLGIREAPHGPAVPADPPSCPADACRPDAIVTVRAILARPLFWAVMVGGGLLNAIGIIGTVHMVAIGIERGLPATQAALLASLMGGASILGAVGVGTLGDRLGGARVLALIAIGFSASWAVIATTTGQLTPIVPAILVIGAVGPGVFTSVTLLFTHIFGAASMPRAVGLFSMFSVPFTFLLPPAAGWLHDVAGSYYHVMSAIIGCGMATALLFWLTGRRETARAHFASTC